MGLLERMSKHGIFPDELSYNCAPRPPGRGVGVGGTLVGRTWVERANPVDAEMMLKDSHQKASG